MFRQNRRIGGGGTLACIASFNSCKHTSNLRKFLVFAVILSLFFDSTIAFSAPRSKLRSARARRNFARSAEAKTATQNTQTPAVITTENSTAKTETLLNENIGTEQVASQTTDTSENDAEVREKIAILQSKISDVKSECSGIKKDLDTIFGFTTATTVASGLGTVAAGGALVAGIKKSKTDKSAEEIEQQLSKKKERLAYIKEKTADLYFSDDKKNIEELEEKNKKDQVIGDARKAVCSAYMNDYKTRLEEVRKRRNKLYKLRKEVETCWSEAYAIDEVAKLREEIRLLRIDEENLCWKYYKKERCPSDPKDCSSYLSGKCTVIGNYEDLEEIKKKKEELSVKIDKNSEYYKKSEECRKIADEASWISDTKGYDLQFIREEISSTFAERCGYVVAAQEEYSPLFYYRSYPKWGDEDFNAKMDELEKELSVDFESFDKKYSAGGFEIASSLDKYTDEKLSRNKEEREEKIALLKEKPVLKKEISELEKELEVLNVNSESTGNLRTGLMAGATVTSAVSTGTSIGATVNAEKLAKKMSDCNEAVRQLKLAISVAEAEEVEEKKLAHAREITSACTGFDKDNINTLKTQMTASAIVSGIGTATAGAGTITSAMANSKKVREDDSEKGRKKEKGLNLASNILAGVTMGTSATSTVLSATAISKAKKDSKMAEECEAVLK